MKHKWHKEIKAWADGAEIEFKVNGEGDWKLLKGNPYWECDNDLFRIKPQPKEPQYLYVYSHKKLNRIDYMLHQKSPILEDGSSDYKYIGKIKLESEDD